MSTKPMDAVQMSPMPPSSHCDANSLTDSYGLTIQVLLACLAFASLILKRLYFESPERRRTWTIWLFDTSKQAVGAGVIHFMNVFLAQILHQKRGDPCTWYVVSFLLDSTLGLLIIYAGVRIITWFASLKHWPTLKFGEYGKPASCRAWCHQCGAFLGIIIIEKIVVTVTLEFRFWRNVRRVILSPITNPKLEVTIVMLIIPFFINTLIFWVVDNFTMMKMASPLLGNGSAGGEINGKGKIRKNTKKNAGRAYLPGNMGSADEDSESGERLLVEEEETCVSTETENGSFQKMAREHDGLLLKRDSSAHLRLNDVSLL